MFPTPDLSHLSSKDYENVYEPAQDTFLFLDALEKDLAFIKAANPLICAEIGSGSGCIVTFLSQLLNNHSTLYFATDINFDACKATKKTSCQNKCQIQVINTKFLEGFKAKIDILICNPPYVLTESTESDKTDIMASWAGGVNGRSMIDKLILQIPDLMSPSSIVYLLLLAQNNLPEIAQAFHSMGFSHSVVLHRKAFNENLFVLKFYR